MLNQFGAGSEFGPVIDRATRQRLLRGLFESYYADREGKEVVFDTNRIWCAKLPALLDLFPDAKVICCVRNVAWIMDSLERLYRSNPYENTKLFADDSERNTVYGRVEALAQRNRLVGFAWSALKEAYYGEQASSLLLLDYDLLAQSPQRIISLIYEFLGEKSFVHDFENIKYDAPEFDAALGISGLHRVRPKVGAISRQTVLPPDLFEKYSGLSFWQESKGSAANVVRQKAG
jgi:sulfotransferase